MIVGMAVAGAAATPAYAQERPMGQGEARVTARSDVQMGIEGGPGTSGNKLQDMIAVISSKLGAVRQCYATVTAERPTVQGDLRIRLLLPRGRGRIDVRFEENSPDDRQLTRCIRHHLGGANFGAVARPANVLVSLAFTNTAARGIHETRTRSAAQAEVAVTRTADGFV